MSGAIEEKKTIDQEEEIIKPKFIQHTECVGKIYYVNT